MSDKIPFDYLGARKAGYSDTEIQQFLKEKYQFDFDIAGARNSGYSDKEISDYIISYEPPSKKKEISTQPSQPYYQESSEVGPSGLKPLNVSPEQLQQFEKSKQQQPRQKGLIDTITATESTKTKDTQQAEIRKVEQEIKLENQQKEYEYAQKAIEEGKGDLLETATAFMAEQDPKFKGQLEKLQESDYLYEQGIGDILAGTPSVPMKNRAETIFGEATTGNILFNAMTNPRFTEEIKKNQQLYAQYREEAGNLINHYPEFGKVYLGGIISKALEEEGETNAIGNIISKSKLDRVVAKLKERGELNEGEIAFINKEIRPKMGVENLVRSILDKPSVKTPGFFENVAQGGVGGLRNFGQAIAEGGPLGGTVLPNFYEDAFGKQGALSRDIERENTRVAFKPMTLAHEIATTGGNMLGQSLATGGGARGLMSLGIKSPAVALGTASFLQAYGNYAPEARKMFPDSKTKQVLYTNSMSAIEAGTEGMFNDIKIVNAILGKVQPTVKHVIEDFTQKKISEAAAKQTIGTALKSAIEKTPSALKSFGKAIGQNELEELTADILSQGVEGVFENKPLDEWINWEQTGEVARSTLWGSVPLAAIATYADMKNKQGITAKQIYLMARDPESWSKQIRESQTDPADANDIQDKLGNLEYAANLLKELDANTSMSEKQKAKFLLKSLDNKIKSEQQTTATDPILKAKADNEIRSAIKENDKIKQDLLDGKDDGSFEGDKSDDANKDEAKLFEEIYKSAPEGYKATLEAAKSQGNILGGLDYMKDKFAENPIKFREDFGDEITDKVLAQTPTENLQEKLDYLIETNPDDPALAVLDKIITERQKVTDEQLPIGEPIPEAATEAITVDEQASQPASEESKPVEEVAGESQSTGEGQPPISEPPKTEKPDNSELMRLSHADTEKIYNELGLAGRLETPRKRREQLDKEVDEMIAKGYNFDKVADETLTGEYRFEDKDQVAFARMVASLKKKQEGLDIKDHEFETIQNRIEKLSRASDVAGTIGGRLLQSRQNYVPKEDSLSDYVVREKEAAAVDVLTDQQKEQVQKEYKDISAAQKAYDEKIAALQEENARLRADAEVKKAKSQSKKGQKKDYKAEREKIFEDIKEKLKKSRSETQATIVPYAKELFAIAPDVAKLMKSYVEQGITELSDIVKKIHGDLKDDIPDITEKDVRDIIAGNYSEKRTRNEKATQLRDLRDEAKLLGQLEALENDETPKSESKKVERNRQIRGLKEKIKKYKDYDKAIEREKENIEKEEGKRAAKEAKAEGKRVEDEYKQEQAAEEAVKKSIEKEEKRDKRTPEEKALYNLKKRLSEQISKLEKDLQTGNYAKEEKKQPIKLDREARELQDELIKLKHTRELRLMKQEYEKSAWYEKAQKQAARVLNLPRTLMATLDYSAPLRQAFVATISHPRTAVKAGVAMFKSSFSQKQYDRWFDNLQHNPRYQIMKDSKLAITDNTAAELSQREEAYMSDLAEKIPLVKSLVKGSARAYSMYLNKMRADVFDQLATQMERRGRTWHNSEEQYKQMAAYVNNITGRGDLGKTLNDSAPILNTLFFSPRLIASRLNTLTYLAQPRFYTKAPRAVRAAYFKDVASTAGVGLLILGLAKAAGAETEDDPRSTEFGKIKVGNTRWDIWGGHQQYIRAISQIVSGKKKTGSGDIKELGGSGPYDQSRGDVAGTFFRGKLAPVPSVVFDIFKGENILGEKITTDWESGKKEVGIKENLATHLLPLIATGTYEAMKDDGVKALFTVGVPSAFGVGVQTYEADPSSIINYKKGGREITSEENKSFNDKVDEEVEKRVKVFKEKGTYVEEGGKIVQKSYNQLSGEERQKQRQSIETSVRNKIKKEMFGEESGKKKAIKSRLQDKKQKLFDL